MWNVFPWNNMFDTINLPSFCEVISEAAEYQGKNNCLWAYTLDYIMYVQRVLNPCINEAHPHINGTRALFHESMVYYIVIAIVERGTRKYHEFIAGYCLRVRSTSKQYPRQWTSDVS